MSTVSGKLSMYFLMCIYLALTTASFLTNALRVWESMVLRIGKEEPTYRFMCCCDRRFRLRTLATMLHENRHPLCSRCGLLLCCVAIFLLEVVCLLFFIESTLTHNPTRRTM